MAERVTFVQPMNRVGGWLGLSQWQLCVTCGDTKSDGKRCGGVKSDTTRCGDVKYDVTKCGDITYNAMSVGDFTCGAAEWASPTAASETLWYILGLDHILGFPAPLEKCRAHWTSTKSHKKSWLNFDPARLMILERSCVLQKNRCADDTRAVSECPLPSIEIYSTVVQKALTLFIYPKQKSSTKFTRHTQSCLLPTLYGQWRIDRNRSLWPDAHGGQWSR